MEGMSNTEVGGVHCILYLFCNSSYLLLYRRYLSRAPQKKLGTYLTGFLLITVLSYSYGITTDRAINAPVHRNNVVDVINVTDKRYLKEKMDLICKLASNNTSII